MAVRWVPGRVTSNGTLSALMPGALGLLAAVLTAAGAARQPNYHTLHVAAESLSVDNGTDARRHGTGPLD